LPGGRINAVRRPSADFIAYCVIALLAVTAPAFTRDDVAFFNYANNVEAAHPLYYYGNYVHVIPQLTAYALRPLPLLYQALLYRLLPLLLTLLLFREMTRLLRTGGTDFVVSIALGTLLVLRVNDASLISNMSMTMWASVLVATCYVTRINAAGGRYSVPGLVGVWIAGSAFPLGVIIAVLLLAHCVFGDPARRRQQAIVAAAIVAAQLALSSGTPASRLNPALLGIAAVDFREGFSDYKVWNLLALAAIATLGSAMWWTWRVEPDSDMRPRSRAVISSLALIGWSTIGLFVISERFARHHGGIDGHYVLPTTMSALLSAGWMFRAWHRPALRPMLIGLFVGLTTMFAAGGLYTKLRGPLELSLMKYRFLQLSEAECARGGPNEVYLFEDDGSSPVVFCRRLPATTEDVLVTVPPAVGGFDPDHETDRGYVLGPKPFVFP
jgi:hypothetical protein